MTVNPTRHLEVFSPREFGDKRVDVVGAGATGSHVAMMLAKLGIINLHVWDADVVEEHNIANQIYFNSHIGMTKLDALEKMILEATGTHITKHDQFLEKGEKDLGAVVFVLTDTMKSRLDIIKNCIFMNGQTQLCIETRMGAESGTVHTFNPTSLADINGWEKTHFPDEEATSASACGASTTVGSTAALISALAVQMFMKWNKTGTIDEKAVDISLRPMLVEVGQLESAAA